MHVQPCGFQVPGTPRSFRSIDPDHGTGRPNGGRCAKTHRRKVTDMPQAILAALCEPTRLTALRVLWGGNEHCVCELMVRCGATQSRMSRHMQVLKGAGLVVDRRDAQWVRYRLNPDLAPEHIAVLSAVLTACAAEDRTAA
jgi:ArsR family transcriptional regulator, arsenate/arsenite/antimonite-responsive transcriptional repressor